MPKVISGTFSAATFRTVGAAATTQNLFTISNAVGSGVLVGVRRLITQLDATAVLTVVMPLVKTSRTTAIPSGGSVLPKVSFDTSEPSNSSVIVRGATASDGGAATAITATPSDPLWQQYAMRMHTLAGQVLAPDNPLIPTLSENTPVILRPGEALVVQVVSAATTSNPNTNHWFVQCVWEEFTVV